MARTVVDHIGIIVEDLHRSMTFFERLLNLKPAAVQEMEAVGLRVARMEAENIAIELIQYTDQGEGFGRKVMGSEPGVNHFSVKAKNVDAAVGRFRQGGVKAMEGFPRRGSHGRVAFFEPATTEKILIEICGP